MMYTLGNLLIAVPGFVYIFWGNLIFNQNEFIFFIKAKAIFLLCIPLASWGMSQAITYMWREQINLKILFYHTIFLQSTLGTIIFFLLNIFTQVLIWFSEFTVIDLFFLSCAVTFHCINNEKLNIYRLINNSPQFLWMNFIRATLNIALFIFSSDYILSIFLSEFLLFITTLKKIKIREIISLDFSLFSMILKRGILLSTMLLVVPVLLFINKFYGENFTIDGEQYLKILEIHYAIYSIPCFVMLRPVVLIYFPLIVKVAKKDSAEYKRIFTGLEKLTIGILISILLMILTLPNFKFIMEIFLIFNISYALCVDILIFACLTSSHLYFLSEYYKVGSLHILLLPLCAACVLQIILSVMAESYLSEQLLQMSLSLGVIFFYGLSFCRLKANCTAGKCILLLIFTTVSVTINLS